MAFLLNIFSSHDHGLPETNQPGLQYLGLINKMLNQPKVGYSIVCFNFPFDLASHMPPTDLRIKSYGIFTESFFLTRSWASRNQSARSLILGPKL